VPDGAVFTIADEIADLMVDLGYQVDEPEKLACRALYAQKADGDWIGLESGIVCGRQNIKTTVMLAGAIHDLFVQDVPKVNWTAHEFKTSTETFGEFRRLIDSHSWLSRRVKRIRESNGKEGVDLHSGARLNILARSKRSGRGMASGRLYGDEALFWTDQQLGAIVPTMSAQKNAHLVHGSSPGMLLSAALRRLRGRGRSMADPYLGWIEWGSPVRPCAREDCAHRPGTAGCQLDDEQSWWLANPALDRRITRDYVRQERLAMPVEEFARERMGWWEDPLEEDDAGPYDVEGYDACLDEDAALPDGATVVFTLDMSWDRSMVHVAVAGFLEPGVPYTREIARMSPSDLPGWLPSRIRRWAPLAIGLQGGSSPAASLQPDLAEAGVDVRLLNGAEIAAACGRLKDMIADRSFKHPDEPQIQAAIQRVVVRSLGDGWVIDRKKSPVDVAGLVAEAEALWLLEHVVGSADYSLADSVH
jgi:hypothetical protein